jgi:Tfp pilus assembly protein PilV
MKDEAGFSLIEVLVSFVILSLTIITSMAIYADNLSRIARLEARIAENETVRNQFSGSATCKDIKGARRTELANQQADWTPYRPFLCVVRSTTGQQPLATIVVEPAEQ